MVKANKSFMLGNGWLRFQCAVIEICACARVYCWVSEMCLAINS